MITSPALEEARQLGDRGLGRLPGRDHHPHDARRGERGDQVGQRGDLGGGAERVVADDLVALRPQPLDHVAAHLPEADHAELHRAHRQQLGEVDAARGAATVRQHLQVAGRLGGHELAEADAPSGDRDVGGVVVQHLDADDLRRPALVQLAGGVEEARAEARA